MAVLITLDALLVEGHSFLDEVLEITLVFQ